MVVLALDTCTEQGSLGLGREGRTLEARALPNGWRSTTLHREIALLLEEYGLQTPDIGGYGVTSGPGSFTGVRLGMTAVKGLAEVHRKQIVPVSTLETAAFAAAVSPSPWPRLFAPILDARRGQVFGAVYREEAGRWKSVAEQTVSALASFIDRVTKHAASEPQIAVTFCGINLAPFVPTFEKAGWHASLVEVSPCLAGPLVQIATQRLSEGLGVDASLAEANYVRLSDAELFWKS